MVRGISSFLKARIGIQQKAVMAISVLLLTLVAALVAISMNSNSHAVRTELMKRGRMSTENLAYNAVYATLVGDTAALAGFLDGVMAEQEVVYALILDPKGQVLVSRDRASRNDSGYSGLPKAPVPAGHVDLAAMRDSGSCADCHNKTEIQGRSILDFRAPIVLGEETRDKGAVELDIYAMQGRRAASHSGRVIGGAQIGITLQFMEAQISAMRWSLLSVALALIVLALTVTVIAVRRALKPIDALVVATGKVAGGDYDSKVCVDRDDEVGDLAASFNKMTADLASGRTALVEKRLLEALVTELKETQQQLVQAGKMAAVGQLAAGVAHEINNPLAGIMGYSQLVVEKMQHKRDSGITPEELPKFLSYVENMERQSQRCKQIVQNLLKFARASSQEELQEVNCNVVLRETISFLDHQLEVSQVTVVTRFESGLPAILGHDGKLQQIFTNIIINAMQAVGKAGTITVTTRSAEERVIIEIQDTGEGIPPEIQGKIFEPFFTTKEIGQGTGLGLSVTYGLVQDLHGDIAVHSEVGHGTTFTVSFPVCGSGQSDADRPDGTVASMTPSDAAESCG